MLTRSNASFILLPAKSQSISRILLRLLLSRVGSILLFLLLSAGFVTTVKVLLSPLLTPVPANHPDLISKEIQVPDQNSVINCVPTALKICID